MQRVQLALLLAFHTTLTDGTQFQLVGHTKHDTPKRTAAFMVRNILQRHEEEAELALNPGLARTARDHQLKQPSAAPPKRQSCGLHAVVIAAAPGAEYTGTYKRTRKTVNAKPVYFAMAGGFIPVYLFYLPKSDRSLSSKWAVGPNPGTTPFYMEIISTASDPGQIGREHEWSVLSTPKGIPLKFALMSGLAKMKPEKSVHVYCITTAPTPTPTQTPTGQPTHVPTRVPTAAPTPSPTAPTAFPTALPTAAPTSSPTQATCQSHTFYLTGLDPGDPSQDCLGRYRYDTYWGRRKAFQMCHADKAACRYLFYNSDAGMWVVSSQLGSGPYRLGVLSTALSPAGISSTWSILYPVDGVDGIGMKVPAPTLELVCAGHTPSPLPTPSPTAPPMQPSTPPTTSQQPPLLPQPPPPPTPLASQSALPTPTPTQAPTALLAKPGTTRGWNSNSPYAAHKADVWKSRTELNPPHTRTAPVASCRTVRFAGIAEGAAGHDCMGAFLLREPVPAGERPSFRFHDRPADDSGVLGGADTFEESTSGHHSDSMYLYHLRDEGIWVVSTVVGQPPYDLAIKSDAQSPAAVKGTWSAYDFKAQGYSAVPSLMLACDTFPPTLAPTLQPSLVPSVDGGVLRNSSGVLRNSSGVLRNSSGVLRNNATTTKPLLCKTPPSTVSSTTGIRVRLLVANVQSSAVVRHEHIFRQAVCNAFSINEVGIVEVSELYFKNGQSQSKNGNKCECAALSPAACTSCILLKTLTVEDRTAHWIPMGLNVSVVLHPAKGETQATQRLLNSTRLLMHELTHALRGLCALLHLLVATTVISTPDFVQCVSVAAVGYHPGKIKVIEEGKR
jgi:cell division septation protein DedD